MILLTKFNTKDFPGVSDGKTFVYNVGDPGSIPGLGRSPGEGNGNPLQYYCLVKSRVQRILVGYRPWDRKESDMTERLHFHFHFQHLFIIKILQKMGIEGNYLNIIKAIYNKPTTNNILTGEN